VLALAAPERFTATMSKEKRKGKIFIDWLMNQRGATSVLPYSARARQGAPVATPISWEELGQCDSAARFSIADAALLVDRAASAGLRGWGLADQTLPDVKPCRGTSRPSGRSDNWQNLKRVMADADGFGNS
jgi:bifunctional non-homologous end joining protein LigD